jgi:hypothetical protein
MPHIAATMKEHCHAPSTTLVTSQLVINLAVLLLSRCVIRMAPLQPADHTQLAASVIAAWHALLVALTAKPFDIWELPQVRYRQMTHHSPYIMVA